MKYLCNVLLGFLLFDVSMAQTKVETKKIILKDTVFEKIIAEKSGNYLICTDGKAFIKELDPDSVFDSPEQYTKKKSTEKELLLYFSSHDTLMLPLSGDSYLCCLFESMVERRYTAPLARGEGIVYNLLEKRPEQSLFEIKTIIIEIQREGDHLGFDYETVKSRSIYQLLSADKKT